MLRSKPMILSSAFLLTSAAFAMPIDLGPVAPGSPVVVTPVAVAPNTGALFSFDIPELFEGGFFTVATSTAGQSTCSTGVGTYDTELGLYASDGTTIANDDDGGPGLCSLITFTGPSSAQTFQTTVSSFNTLFFATLDDTVFPGVTGTGITLTIAVDVGTDPGPGSCGGPAGQVCDAVDFAVLAANTAFNSNVVVESASKARLRPSTIYGQIDGIVAANSGCVVPLVGGAGGAYLGASQDFFGSTEFADTIVGTFGGGQIAGMWGPPVDVSGVLGGGEVSVTDGGLVADGFYTRVAGKNGVWVGAGAFCPVQLP